MDRGTSWRWLQVEWGVAAWQPMCAKVPFASHVKAALPMRRPQTKHSVSASTTTLFARPAEVRARRERVGSDERRADMPLTLPLFCGACVPSTRLRCQTAVGPEAAA